MIFRQFSALIRLSLLDLYRRKDLFVLLVLSLVLLAPLAMIQPFGVTGASRYMNEVAMLLIWIFSIVITLGVTSRLFPPEFESRTIYPLLAKPIGRGTLLFGKYLGALTTSLSALLFFYLLYGMMIGLRQGEWFPPIFMQAFLLHVGFIVLLAALGLFGSLLVTPSANMTLCGIIVGGMLFYGQRLPALVEVTPVPVKWFVWLGYAIGPHFEFFDMRQRLIHSWSMVRWDACLLTLLYACVYSAACLLLANALLKRKKL